jgi:glucokinase
MLRQPEPRGRERAMILAGDIGGTKTNLATFTNEGGELEVVAEQRFVSHDYAGLEEIIKEFIADNDSIITDACFGIACPVVDGRCETPNLPWVIDSRLLAEELRLQRVALLNDLEATAHGIAALAPADFVTLNEGVPHGDGNAALIAAGTGLGEAILFWDGALRRVSASEGGHVDFAPRNELEVNLLLFLLNEFEHVSYERVLSGSGLHNIYRFLRDTGRAHEPEWLAEEMRRQDAPAIISRAALEGGCELCAQALDLFISFYGAEAGNLALKALATGGVYVGGGIAPKIVRKLVSQTFIEAFTAKGRMKQLMEAIPVRIILNDKTALLGAARFASLQASR